MHFLRFSILRKNLDCVLLSGLIATLAIVSCLFIYGSNLTNTPIRSDALVTMLISTLLIDPTCLLIWAKKKTNQGSNLALYGIGLIVQLAKCLAKVSLVRPY